MLKEKVAFTCEKCGKTIDVQEDIYNKAYKDEKYCLDCRNK